MRPEEEKENAKDMHAPVRSPAAPDDRSSTYARGPGDDTVEARAAASEVTLFSSWFCPYAQRAWIALEEVATPYQYVR